MKLYIKNMVCIRCKMVVKDELGKLGLHPMVVELGEAEIVENISAPQREQIKAALLRSGLELMDDKKSVLIEKIKNVILSNWCIIRMEPLTINFSEYLSGELNHDYTLPGQSVFRSAGHYDREVHYRAQDRAGKRIAGIQ